ncbi:MAG: hypothetical protein WC545_01420 [Patescibacteria group bacterium]
MTYLIYYILIFLFIILFSFLVFATNVANYLVDKPFISIIAFFLLMFGIHYLDDWVDSTAKKRGDEKKKNKILISIIWAIFATVMIIGLLTKG